MLNRAGEAGYALKLFPLSKAQIRISIELSRISARLDDLLYKGNVQW